MVALAADSRQSRLRALIRRESLERTTIQGAVLFYPSVNGIGASVASGAAVGPHASNVLELLVPDDAEVAGSDHAAILRLADTQGYVDLVTSATESSIQVLQEIAANDLQGGSSQLP
jgi:hypothetical protein